MKLPLIFLSFFLLPLFCLSQINTSIDFIGGIDYTYRNLKNTSNDPDVDNFVIPFRNNDESGKLNLRFGFNFNKKISKKIFFKTGLRFASVGYKGKKREGLRFGNEVLEQLMNSNSISIPNRSIQFIYNYLFLELPIIGRYEFSQKKFTPFVELGIAPSLYLKSRHKRVYNNDAQILDGDEELYNYSKIHFIGVLSFGGNYKISDGLQLFAQPTFRYHFNRLINDAPIKENLWNVGLEVGLRKRLK